MSRLAARLTVVVLAATTVGLGATGPAQAATCASAHGVSVVVDFHQLGGEVQADCDATGGGKYADKQFAAVGHELSYVQGEAFVCQVDGAPDRECPRTPPADAYWSLWWSDGKSGTWRYASTGVTSLKVPDGGYVALSWQGQASQAPPRVKPSAHATSTPSPSATPRPSSSPHPSSSPSPASSSTAPDASGRTSSPASGAAGPTSGRSTSGGPAKHHATPTKRTTAKGAGHDPNRTEAAAPLGAVASSGSTTGSSDGGLPGWVAPIAVAVLFLGSGAVVVARRRHGGG